MWLEKKTSGSPEWLIRGVKVGEEQRKMREILLVTDEIYADYGPTAVLLFGFRLA